MTKARTFSYNISAPIPQGHRVEISIFARNVLFGSGIDEDEALVHDLETNIYYGKPWHLLDEGGFTSYDLQPSVDPALELVKQIKGTAVSAYVVYRGGKVSTFFTLLTLKDVTIHDLTNGPNP